jgi:hypothetical protein
MKKNILLFSVLLLIGAGSVGIYQYKHRPEQDILVDGHALLPQLTKEELIRQSDVILTGKVRNLDSIKISSEIRAGEEDIVTNVILDVEKYLRNYTNASPQEVTVQVLGGKVGNLTMNVEHAPSFKEGEHVLVFLKQEKNGIFTAYGWAQGKYSIDDKGNVGIGEQELAYLQNIFGSNLYLVQLEEYIESFNGTAPREENTSSDYYLNNENIDSNSKNKEANSVLAE